MPESGLTAPKKSPIMTIVRGSLDELRRIYNDCLKDHGCSDDDIIVTVLGAKCNSNSREDLDKKGLTRRVKNANVKIPTHAFHVCPWSPPLSLISRSANPQLGQGAGYGIGINFPEILRLQGGDCSVAVATVLAHEVQEAMQEPSLLNPKGNAHVGNPEEFVDSDPGRRGGKLSPQGCRNLLNTLGVKTK